MSAGSAARLALVTAPDADTARTLVRQLVDEELIACGNIVSGVTSYFRWKGAIECEAEVLCILKTSVEAASRLIERVPELHPYDVPEVLVFTVEAGFGPYLNWISESVSNGV